MSIIRRLSILWSTVLVLSSAYVLLSLFRGLGNALGVTEPTGIGGVLTSLAILLTLGIGLLVGTICLVAVIGYAVLTGWRGFSRIPAIFKLLGSFLVGIIVLLLSMPLGAVLPLPLLPTIIIAAVLWFVLRRLSGSLQTDGSGPITVDQAEAIAAQTLRQHLSKISLTPIGTRLQGRLWKVSFIGSNSQIYEVNVDSHAGSALAWGMATK